MKKAVRSVLCIGLLSIAALVLSACGRNQEATEITMVLDWTPNTNHTGLYVALANGYFEEEGLNVNLIQPPEDGAAMLVAGGGAQFGIDFQEWLAPAFASDNPLPITAVATILQHNTSGFLSLKDKGIETPKDMAGHTYATWQLPGELAIVKYVMEQDGANFDDLVQVPNNISNAVTAIQTNVDLVWVYYAWDGIAAQVAGVQTNFINLATFDPILDYYSPVIIANNTYLEQHPEETKRFLRAVRKGYEYAIAHAQEAAEILLAAAPELNGEIVMESQMWLADQYRADAQQWGIIDAARWDGFFAWLYEQGALDQEIPAGVGFSMDYLE